MTKNIAVLGTGLMGAPMARNIAAGGYQVTAWNRTAAKARALGDAGISAADTPAVAVAQADFVISMLSDGKALLALLEEDTLQKALRPGTLWIDMSSARPGEARAAADRLSGIDVGFIDAPVSGGPGGAEAGTLAIMAGAAPEDFEKARALLATMGRPTRVGPVGAGQLAKLANQAIVGITIAAVAEATLLLERGGADPAGVREALRGGFADSTVLQLHGARMQQRDFTPGGPARLQLKDMENVLSEAGELNLPTVRQTRDRYARYLAELDGAERDHSGLFEELLDLNGLLTR